MSEEDKTNEIENSFSKHCLPSSVQAVVANSLNFNVFDFKAETQRETFLPAESIHCSVTNAFDQLGFSSATVFKNPYIEQQTYDDVDTFQLYNKVNVLLDSIQKGKYDDERNKEYLELILHKQEDVINYQKKFLDSQEQLIDATKKQTIDLSLRIEHLQNELSKTEQRLKTAIEKKYHLAESDILKAIKVSTPAYTLFFSKISLLLSVMLLSANLFLDIMIIDTFALFVIVIASLTYFLMGLRGSKDGNRLE